MSTIKDGGPAFPEVQTVMGYDIGTEQHFPETYSFGGMSLRDYFAALAMQSCPPSINDVDHNYKRIATHAYRMADAMLKAREQQP